MNSAEAEFLQSHNIKCIKEIGIGGFGSIYYVYSTKYKANFAMKKIPKKVFKQNEIDCMMAIDEPHIVRLFEYFMFEDYVYMIIEYCENDLEKMIENSHNGMKNDALKMTIYDICKCIKVCHDHKIAHCDIKPSNFLIDKYGRIKICDFGLSMQFSSSKASIHHFRGTINFMAPELFTINDFNPMKTDIWSLGVTMYFVATGIFPFKGRDSIERGVYNEVKVHNTLLRDLISNCLDSEPNNRPNILIIFIPTTNKNEIN